MIQLAVFDIDRTLIDPAVGELAPETAAAIRCLQHKGIRTVIASGRQLHLLAQELRDLDFDYYILSNGSYITDTAGTVLYQEAADAGTVRELVEEMTKRGYPVCLRFTDGISEGNPNCTITQAAQADWGHKKNAGEAIKALQRQTKLPQGTPPVSFLGHIPVEEQPWFIQRFPELEFLPVFEGPMCDINIAGVSKATGLERICALTGIPMAQTIAFGDDRNDLEMVAAAGIGVAMGDSLQAVQDAADYITTPCRELGVVKALRHFDLID